MQQSAFLSVAWMPGRQNRHLADLCYTSYTCPSASRLHIGCHYSCTKLSYDCCVKSSRGEQSRHGIEITQGAVEGDGHVHMGSNVSTSMIRTVCYQHPFTARKAIAHQIDLHIYL
jgi:hypothetical protein